MKDKKKNDQFEKVLDILERVFTQLDLLAAVILIGFSVVYITRWPVNSGSYLPMCLGLAIIAFNILRHIEEKTKRQKIAQRVLLIGLSYFLASFAVFCNVTFKSSSLDVGTEHDAIIVLGAGLRNGDQLSGTLQQRLDKAIEIYNGKEVPIVVSGGQGPDELVSEASVMKDYLVQMGIDESDIYIEDKSTSTEENFAYSKVILDELFTDDYVVIFTTNNFHVFRASRYMKDAGLVGYGAGTDSIASLIPYNYLREYMAIHLYFLTNLI